MQVRINCLKKGLKITTDGLWTKERFVEDISEGLWAVKGRLKKISEDLRTKGRLKKVQGRNCGLRKS